MYILFDAVIALIVVAVPLYFVQLIYRWRTMASRGPSVFIAAVLTVVWVVIVYGSFVEPRFLVTRHEQVTIGEGESLLKIVAVSDLHLGRHRHADWTVRVIERINFLEPDVVVLLGDLVDGRSGHHDLEPLKYLRSTYGTYAVLGNTDYKQGAVDVRHAIERWNVEVLTNEWVRLGDDGPVLSGLDDIWFGTPDWGAALADIPEGAPVIMVVHNPDEAGRAEYEGVDLLLAGHTHGGQIRLPFWGPVPRLPTTIGQEYDQGLFPWGAMQLYITSGAGESGVRSRLFNPPEVVQLDVLY